jgi:hypothetical protein
MGLFILAEEVRSILQFKLSLSLFCQNCFTDSHKITVFISYKISVGVTKNTMLLNVQFTCEVTATIRSYSMDNGFVCTKNWQNTLLMTCTYISMWQWLIFCYALHPSFKGTTCLKVFHNDLSKFSGENLWHMSVRISLHAKCQLSTCTDVTGHDLNINARFSLLWKP